MRIACLLPRVVAGSVVAGCALLGTVANAGNEIHRCNDGGRITYTDRGCSGRGEVLVIAMAPTSTNSHDNVAVHARVTPALLGMSWRAVYDTMGRPLETIAMLEGRTLVEYWIYRGVEGSARVAFQEGRVTRIDAR